MSSGGFSNSTLGSLQCVIGNWNNMLDGISVQEDLWAINDVVLYGDLTVINFNNFSRFQQLVYLAL